MFSSWVSYYRYESEQFFFFSNSQITDCMTFNIYALIIWRNTHYSLVCQISVPRLLTFEIFVSPWWSYQDLPPFIKILELIFSARKLELQFISEYCSAEVFYSLYSYLCQITRSKCLVFWLECHKNQRYYEDISSIKSVVLICYDIIDIYDIITYQCNTLDTTDIFVFVGPSPLLLRPHYLLILGTFVIF